MLKLRKGDTVKITSGKDKGRKGKIEKIYLKQGTILIPGINVYKKHVKGYGGQKAGIYDLPRPILSSKTALVCPKCKKTTRVGFKLKEKGKVRVCLKCKKEIDSKK